MREKPCPRMLDGPETTGELFRNGELLFKRKFTELISGGGTTRGVEIFLEGTLCTSLGYCLAISNYKPVSIP